MAVTLQGPAAYILLPPATFSVFLPGIVAAVPTEPDPEPLGWSAAAPPETARPLDQLHPGKCSGHSIPTSLGLSGHLLDAVSLHPQSSAGIYVARYVATGYH